jgi:hypothetical protein
MTVADARPVTRLKHVEVGQGTLGGATRPGDDQDPAAHVQHD